MTKAEFQRNEYLNELASTLVDEPKQNYIADMLRMLSHVLLTRACGESLSASVSLFAKSDAYNEIAELAEKESWIKCSPLVDQPELFLCHNCGDLVQVGMLHRCPWNPEGPKVVFIESPKPDQKPDQPDQSSQLYHLLDYADKEARHAQQQWRKCKANELFTNPEYYTGRHDSMTIIIGEIMRLINNQSIVDSFTMIDAKQATPGRFYESEKWGRVLCCGSGNHEEWLPAFAVRTDGRTQMKYLSGEVRESAVQGW